MFLIPFFKMNEKTITFLNLYINYFRFKSLFLIISIVFSKVSSAYSMFLKRIFMKPKRSVHIIFIMLINRISLVFNKN